MKVTVDEFCREEWITSIQEVADKFREREKEDSDEISIQRQKMVCYLLSIGLENKLSCMNKIQTQWHHTKTK